MEEFEKFLVEFKAEVVFWLENPTVNAPLDPMRKVLAAIDLSLEAIRTKNKIAKEKKELFEGGVFLVKYFEGWGENYFYKYSKMATFIKRNHY
ncbi:MAG: hypothetical protein JHD28_02435, partial [Bacteroidia bacterium]|nr:hypothetical protein [Bacteroidia bacterium]